jgi:hypothetical protein
MISRRFLQEVMESKIHEECARSNAEQIRHATPGQPQPQPPRPHRSLLARQRRRLAAIDACSLADRNDHRYSMIRARRTNRKAAVLLTEPWLWKVYSLPML